MQVFFAIILAALFLHQIPTLNEFVGCLLIGSASCLAVLNTQKAWAQLRRRFRQPTVAELKAE
jgi:drug/metabolite transporter (DMT)-like permease